MAIVLFFRTSLVSAFFSLSLSKIDSSKKVPMQKSRGKAVLSMCSMRAVSSTKMELTCPDLL